MKFTLKDYQDDAVRDVLQNLRKATRRWHEDGERSAFSLTATTGAGKTVMAAAVFESLFYGDDASGAAPDSGAVVIWLSDDPSLNEQSRFRLREASDRIPISSLVTIQNTFNRDKLEGGKVYFLNTQKLGRSSLLVRGADDTIDGSGADGRQGVMPDLRSFTIWDIIQNTIDDPSLTLFLVLDEAHRGMKTSTRSLSDERPTIVKRLINGSGGTEGIPVVWGISATVERFNSAISEMEDRTTLPNVVVDAVKVQSSGLLKDTIILDVPTGVGQYDTVLVRRGTEKLKDISKAWDAYAIEQRLTNGVVPLMVLQVPNTPDHAEIGAAIATIYKHWPSLPDDAVAHVFGEHTVQTFGPYNVPYISPERVQESTWVRILIAKDAISTGWDCPRAEVMVSFRPVKDKTQITQLLGRMVRTPLARRIPGNERLNSVDCLLPFFDARSVKEVAIALMSGVDSGEELSERRVLINPKEMRPNKTISSDVWDKLLSLPSQSLPRRQTRPVKRLMVLAHELAVDRLLDGAGKLARTEMHKSLDAASARYSVQIAEARTSVLTVEGKSLRAELHSKRMSFDDFVEAADNAAIEAAYRRSARVIGFDLAKTYVEYLATSLGDGELDEETLNEAHTVVAALGMVSEVSQYLDAEADKQANLWLTTYRVQIKDLGDERQDVYRLIREMSPTPMDIDLAKPRLWMQPTVARGLDGTETPIPRLKNHLLCDEEGLFPEQLNAWEEQVVAAELERASTVAWYRNPPRASQDSLGVTYEDNGSIKITRPDFIFFSELPDGSIAADIVDPHGIHLSDSVPKLRGMAEYARVNHAAYRRVDAIAKVGDRYRVLDLTEPTVRAAVNSASSIQALYESGAAADYVA
ncbi:DEAD/DEAH box helicase family protein [Sphingomonas sp. LB3N6]|uniref:DEAD/DEAH box helicase n=1 Tax=Sphingomonas fucosidasi TaxID=3096164 RepID=UPI002FC8EB8E